MEFLLRRFQATSGIKKISKGVHLLLTVSVRFLAWRLLVHRKILIENPDVSPFIPKDRLSMRPALSSLRKPFTTIERVMPAASAILLVTIMPSNPSNSCRMRWIACCSEKDRELRATWQAVRCLTLSSGWLARERVMNTPKNAAEYSARNCSASVSLRSWFSTRVPTRSPPPTMGQSTAYCLGSPTRRLPLPYGAHQPG